MGLFAPSTDVKAARAVRSRSLAQMFVREVHTTLFQLFVYVCLLGGVGLAVLEIASRPAAVEAMNNASEMAKPSRGDWIAVKAEPALRGRQ